VKQGFHLGLVGPLPPPAGGMATQTRQLVSLLGQENINVHLLQNNKPYRPRVIEGIKGVRAIFRLLPYLLTVWKMAGRVDVIHLMANSGWSWQLFSAPVIWIGNMRKTPVIVNYRGGGALNYFSNSIRWVSPTLKRATCIVVPSAYLETVFSGFGFKTRIIPNIIDLARFKPGQQEENPEIFHLIITRNLEPIYGIETAIRAIARVKEQIPGIQLTIAGSGPQRGELESLVKKSGLQDKVTFTGRLDSEKVLTLYQSADVMLNPTTTDNMPNSVLESMACGVPVITTNVGGIPYIVENEETALLVAVGDDKEMAKQIVRLYLEPQLRRKLRIQGLEAVKPYSWPKVKSQWLSLYDTLKIKT